MARKMYLTNANGHTYSLNPADSAAFHSLSDMGYEIAAEYRRIGDVYRLIADPRVQLPITGQVYFRNGNQKEYREFINFLQIKPLILHYDPTGDDEYLIDGTVTKVVYNDGNARTVTVTFKPETPPYKMITLQVDKPDENTPDGKIYKVPEGISDPDPDAGYYTYADGTTYDTGYYTYSSSTPNIVIFDNENIIKTPMDCPLKLTIYGPLVNPTWTQYDNTGTRIASGKVNRSIPADDHIVIDAHVTPYSMKEFDEHENLVVDLYESSDFGTERFLMLKQGANRIVISDDGGNYVRIIAEGKIFYASV